MKQGFTLIETLVVVAIIAILASTMLPALNAARSKTHFVRAKAEFKSMFTALELYKNDYGEYPPDASRNIPPGLGPYLAGQGNEGWPLAPWPGSVYDWDNWDDPDHPGEKIYQITIRFCPAGGTLADCRFPQESWANDFGINSGVYYCVSGNCRAHSAEPITYPGYCVNCDIQPSQP